MLEYGMNTILNRAVPDFRDGMKPVQRRLMWAACEMGLWPDKGFKKAATVVARTMGAYHPVGDMAIYEALVGLVNSPCAPFDGQGNWGTPSRDISEAANRYTECRLADFGRDILLDPYYLNVIETTPNYDGLLQEPVVLPARLPLVLLNGAQGIAVGAVTRIPTFGQEGIKKLLEAVLKRADRTVTAKDCAKYLQVVCQHGGILVTQPADMKPLWETGICKLSWECAHTVDLKKRTITITGLPPDWSFTAKTDALEAHPSVKQVVDLSSGTVGVSVQILLKPGSAAETEAAATTIINKYLKSSFWTRMNVTERTRKVTADGFVEPTATFKAVGVAQLLTDWIAWRVDLEKKAAVFIAAELQHKINREDALLRASRNLDAVIKIIRSKTIKDKIAALSKLLKIEPVYAQIVWETPLGRFDRLSDDVQLSKIKDMTADLKAAKVRIKEPAQATLVDLKRLDRPKAKGKKK